MDNMKNKQFSMMSRSKHGPFFLIKILVVVFVLMFAIVVVYDRASTSPVDAGIALKHLKLFLVEKTTKIRPYFPKPRGIKK